VPEPADEIYLCTTTEEDIDTDWMNPISRQSADVAATDIQDIAVTATDVSSPSVDFSLTALSKSVK